MNTPNAFVLTRSVERILVTLTGAFAIFLGYKLFATVPTAESGADVKTATIQIYISHVGPGIFFALFGTGLIGYSVTRSVRFEQKVLNDGTVLDVNYRGMMPDRPGRADGPPRSSVPCEGVVKILAEMANELGGLTGNLERRWRCARHA